MRALAVGVIAAAMAAAGSPVGAQDAARSGADAAGSQVVDITREPSHHLVLDNADVRVFDVRVAPHATTLVHRHRHDYLFVTLGDAAVTTTRVGEAPVRLLAPDGEVRFTPGGFAHSATNDGDRPFHNTTIELRHASTHAESCTEACAEPTACLVAGDAVGATPCPTAMRLAAADQWRVLTVTLPVSADVVLPDTVGPVLLVAVSDVQLAFARPHGGGGMRGEAGVLGWIAAPPGAASPVADGAAGHGAGRGGSRVVTNEGAKPARLVLLEFRRMAPAVPAG